jgi:hypothetical protein
MRGLLEPVRQGLVCVQINETNHVLKKDLGEFPIFCRQAAGAFGSPMVSSRFGRIRNLQIMG